MLTSINDIIKPINDNKFILAIIMMFLNISSKHIDFGFTKIQEHALKNIIAREIIIFSIIFVGTRDVIMSFLLTILFFISIEYFFNENSKFCLIPNHLNRMKQVVQQNEGHVTDIELHNALETLKRAEKNNQLNIQNKFINFMKYNKI